MDCRGAKAPRNDEVYKMNNIGYNSDMKHHYCFCKKCAFTLAEVLITLGIIGIVAALTMPVLISKYQKHVWYNSFMTSASTVENLMRKYCDDNDMNVDSDCLNYYDDPDILSKISKFTNGAKVIDTADSSNIAYLKTLNGNIMCGAYSCGSGKVLVLSNGITVFDLDIWDSDWAIDTNGPYKGPNTLGRDIFIFMIRNKFLWAGVDDPNAEDYWKDNEQSSGLYFAGRLLEEGKMNY